MAAISIVPLNFDKFKRVTGYNIKDFFQRYYNFFTNDYNSIVSYYKGGSLNQSAFAELDYLLKQVTVIESLFWIHSIRLDTIDFWEMLDLFTEMQTKLLTAKKTGKWLRSSRLNLNDVNPKVKRVQGQNETIESIADDLGYDDSQNTWVDIAISNLVTEDSYDIYGESNVGYTNKGGRMFTVSLKNNASISLSNIVDYFTPENILGKDIDKKIIFENNDLKVLSGKDAVNQSFGIKLGIKKNSIPEFPDKGIVPENIGTNVSTLSYPSIFRNLLALFRDDQRWRSVSILNLRRKDSAVFLEIEAKTITNDPVVTNLKI